MFSKRLPQFVLKLRVSPRNVIWTLSRSPRHPLLEELASSERRSLRPVSNVLAADGHHVLQPQNPRAKK
jgi:hypothetical protein